MTKEYFSIISVLFSSASANIAAQALSSAMENIVQYAAQKIL